MEPQASPSAAPVQQDPETVLGTLYGMVDNLLERLPYIGAALLVFVLFFVVAKGVRLAVRRFSEQRRRHRNLGLVLGRLAQFVVVLAGLLIALVIALPGFTPGRLVELLGLSSVAIGFAFRDILQNFLAGILLLVTEPFRIGDQIVFGGYEGTVEEIQTRATYMRTYDGRRIVIPNSELFINSVTVNTAFAQRRLEYDVGIGYGDDVATAKLLMLEAVRSVDGVLADPAPDAIVVALGESSVIVRVRWWITPPRRADALETQDRVIAAIKQKVYIEHGIDLPYPTRQILFHDQTEESDGDRARQREGWPAGREPPPRPLGIARTLRAQAHDETEV